MLVSLALRQLPLQTQIKIQTLLTVLIRFMLNARQVKFKTPMDYAVAQLTVAKSAMAVAERSRQE